MENSLVVILLDILMVSILIYHILVWFKSTRALQLIVGMLVIALLLNLFKSLSLFFGFTMLGWLLSNLLSILAISFPVVLAVIFQPELRRFLGKLGTRRTLLGNAFRLMEFSYLKDASIDQICKCIEILSRKKVGGLIVIERESSLSPFLESGVTIGSEISTELLVTIFTPPSLLHDGAVVVKNDQILSARVILPLTENLYISKNFGTRHRAGIGITEETDAITIIVSEQDSRISLSVSGRITSNLTLQELKEMLMVMCKSRKKGKKKA
jgi:diadenylate cyclase